jgi:hypothetical protein
MESRSFVFGATFGRDAIFVAEAHDVMVDGIDEAHCAKPSKNHNTVQWPRKCL